MLIKLLWTHFKSVIFKLTSKTDIFSIFCEIALSGMPEHLTDDSALTVNTDGNNYYLNQSWPSSMVPYGATMS